MASPIFPMVRIFLKVLSILISKSNVYDVITNIENTVLLKIEILPSRYLFLKTQ